MGESRLDFITYFWQPSFLFGESPPSFSPRCEICGFTCRQKASLNWHMKKHDADSFYQFSCDLCGKKFEKKDNVTAHKSKSHPEGATGPLPPAQEPPPLSSPLAAEPMANPVQTQQCDIGKGVEPPALAITVIIE